MKLEIRTDNTEFPATLPAYLEHRLQLALAPFAGSVRRVTARVSRFNGPGTADQKCCRIILQLSPSSSIALEETDGDVYRAIDRATQQAARLVRKRLEDSRLSPAA